MNFRKSKHFSKAANPIPNMSVYSVKTRIPEFEKAKDYLNSLAEKLIIIEKISNRINKERLGIINNKRFFSFLLI